MISVCKPYGILIPYLGNLKLLIFIGYFGIAKITLINLFKPKTQNWLVSFPCVLDARFALPAKPTKCQNMKTKPFPEVSSKT